MTKKVNFGLFTSLSMFAFSIEKLPHVWANSRLEIFLEKGGDTRLISIKGLGVEHDFRTFNKEGRG
jgi:hypothetical protein